MELRARALIFHGTSIEEFGRESHKSNVTDMGVFFEERVFVGAGGFLPLFFFFFFFEVFCF